MNLLSDKGPGHPKERHLDSNLVFVHEFEDIPRIRNSVCIVDPNLAFLFDVKVNLWNHCTWQTKKFHKKIAFDSKLTHLWLKRRKFKNFMGPQKNRILEWIAHRCGSGYREWTFACSAPLIPSPAQRLRLWGRLAAPILSAHNEETSK